MGRGKESIKKQLRARGKLKVRVRKRKGGRNFFHKTPKKEVDISFKKTLRRRRDRGGGS